MTHSQAAVAGQRLAATTGSNVAGAIRKFGRRQKPQEDRMDALYFRVSSDRQTTENQLVARARSAPRAEQVRALRVSGHGYKTIARVTRVSATTVRRILGAKSVQPGFSVNPAESTPVEAVA